MKTTVSVIAGLLAIKELELRVLKERVNYLASMVNTLQAENEALYKMIEKGNEIKEHPIGFKGGLK